ncbi:uncharacterized protein F4812DRAFT_213332 [Daldinia caldariorum]|uniref:uncharacterized protein n=1 Tax=Daldinia caldariorum TaxID=326644 RepID=UPI0020073536|nr:uncharacterized protein F4812DRAFT_213332 [Daldinia caldariorum]KAI1464142.1 hypothetical protein F4812DRAFT_213332 [Daldinia caldariorum]
MTTMYIYSYSVDLKYRNLYINNNYYNDSSSDISSVEREVPLLLPESTSSSRPLIPTPLRPPRIGPLEIFHRRTRKTTVTLSLPTPMSPLSDNLWRPSSNFFRWELQTSQPQVRQSSFTLQILLDKPLLRDLLSDNCQKFPLLQIPKTRVSGLYPLPLCLPDEFRLLSEILRILKTRVSGPHPLPPRLPDKHRPDLSELLQQYLRDLSFPRQLRSPEPLHDLNLVCNPLPQCLPAAIRRELVPPRVLRKSR